MLNWTFTFIVLALIAGVLGFTGIMGGLAWLAQVCFGLFIVLFLIRLLTGKSPA